ncbi:MAG: hypothetical protein LIO63_07815 [Akkermansia sp.]|nr:hypothetical protein [Akkermansia sp.]
MSFFVFWCERRFRNAGRRLDDCPLRSVRSFLGLETRLREGAGGLFRFQLRLVAHLAENAFEKGCDLNRQHDRQRGDQPLTGFSQALDERGEGHRGTDGSDFSNEGSHLDDSGKA